MKKGDKILIFLVAIVLIVSFIIWAFVKNEVGTKVVITKNNKVVYKASLFENKTVELGSNTVQIKNGKVSVTFADCKNQICKNHKEISKKGESIICLPNKVIAQIK